MSAQKIRVWINGARYGSFAAAAARMNLLLGWKAGGKFVSAVVKAGTSRTVNGVTVSAFPPGEAGADKPGSGGSEALRAPLLRYPLGHAPTDRGVCRSER